MTYKGYTGEVKYDADAGVFHGSVAGITDVITFEAKGASDIEKAFRDSVDEYLEFCDDLGEEPERPSSEAKR